VHLRRCASKNAAEDDVGAHAAPLSHAAALTRRRLDDGAAARERLHHITTPNNAPVARIAFVIKLIHCQNKNDRYDRS
jgi:hypothetical protein